ncbi:MAG: endonuclease III [Ignavibacteriales bacterium]|nr:endonuclease III [Ignavibacteriales bacterium]
MAKRKSARSVDWAEKILPLIKLYNGRKHPLEYQNAYQLVVMVILAAQDSDRHINSIAPELFKAFPSMKDLAKAKPEEVFKHVETVRNFWNKTKWLISMAQAVGEDKNIPTTMDELTQLSGIGRKSANVIKRELGALAEGISVDLHVVRVAPRLGMVSGTNPDKIEKQLMEVVPRKHWAEAGMAMSFLGRETCRPTNPNCAACVMNKVCAYYKAMKK